MAAPQTTPIKLHLHTSIDQAGQHEEHTFDENGEVTQVGSSLYIRYFETSEGQGLPVMVKVASDGTVQLSRGNSKTDSQVKLYFNSKVPTLANYRTPYGRIPLKTVTNNLVVKIKAQPLSGEINLMYQLFDQEQNIGDYRLRLLFSV